jgi:hypothetical protein
MGVDHEGENEGVGYDNRWYNNTFFINDVRPASFRQVHETQVYNNIFVSGADLENFETRYSYTTLTKLEHNDFYNVGGGMTVRKNRDGTGDTTYTNLAGLHASEWLIDEVNPHGNLTVNPNFTNGSGTYSLPSDFQVQAESLLTGSDTGGLVGADVSLVGIQGDEDSGETPVTIPGPGYLHITP